MSSIKINNSLTSEDVAKVGDVLDFMLKEIGVDGFVALKEIYQESSSRRLVINREINAKLKKKTKSGRGFIGLRLKG